VSIVIRVKQSRARSVLLHLLRLEPLSIRARVWLHKAYVLEKFFVPIVLYEGIIYSRTGGLCAVRARSPQKVRREKAFAALSIPDHAAPRSVYVSQVAAISSEQGPAQFSCYYSASMAFYEAKQQHSVLTEP